MELLIQREDGEIIDTRDLLKLSLFEPSPPQRNPNYQDIEGRRGSLLLSNALASRTIRVELLFIARDKSDFILKRDEVFVLFDSEDPYYIIDSRQPFKRWKVVLESSDPEYVRNRVGKINLTFTAINGMSESTASTLSPLTFDSETWGMGLNIPADDMKYIFNTTKFKVYNAGDIEVDPREKPMVITFRGASENLLIHNLTTGERFKYTGTTDSYDKLILDRLYVRKNDASVFNNTNRQAVRLKKGWNEFQISGTTSSFEIDFDFRFYYL
ncbi:phage tail family protein [Peribacillus frigoritolerans]|uniref:Phage tail family protein n=1 Tax=Peribacillus castrilensis TaxID=2897690 RepID=A0AAW9NQX8_9BACI|nr:phage tail family protein [Peribacillus castrilensis]